MNEETALRRSPRLRRDSYHAIHLPIAMLSAHSGDKFTREAKEAGCDFVLGKPIERNLLLQCLEQVGKAKKAADNPLTRISVRTPQKVRQRGGFLYRASSDGTCSRRWRRARATYRSWRDPSCLCQTWMRCVCDWPSSATPV
jgi:DNA-binding NarL/FixJ family response regulator